MLLIVSDDLAVSSKIAAAARQAGVDNATAMSVAAAVERCRETAPSLVLVDLSTRGLEMATLVPNLRAASERPTRIVAFGPHVHEGLLSAAREAGCDEVLTRGKLHATLDELLRGMAGD